MHENQSLYCFIKIQLISGLLLRLSGRQRSGIPGLYTEFKKLNNNIVVFAGMILSIFTPCSTAPYLKYLSRHFRFRFGVSGFRSFTSGIGYFRLYRFWFIRIQCQTPQTKSNNFVDLKFKLLQGQAPLNKTLPNEYPTKSWQDFAYHIDGSSLCFHNLLAMQYMLCQ